MAKLRVIDGPLAGREYVLGPGVSVAGRHVDCAVSLPDQKASRNHAEFVADAAGQFAIIDVGSANGTFVGGVQLPPSVPRPLAGGDEIRIGQNTLRFFAGDAGMPDLDIPGYILDDVLAEGGMGAIYAARNRESGQPAAIKILHPGYARHDEFIERFIQEARAAGRLSHPNIVRVYNVGITTGGRYYFTMELVKGATLTQQISSLSTAEAARMFLELADALEYAHRHGIIHRDIKPDNILVGPGAEPKLTDLGIAILDSHDMRTRGQKVLGTPHYMSPEQASGNTITSSTDIYSLGATFYHAFAKRPLFDAADPQQIMIKHVREKPQPLAAACPDIPRDLAAIVDKCLEKNPDDRFASAGQLHAAILKSMEKAFPAAIPAGTKVQRKRPGRLPLILAAVLAAVLVILGVLLFLG